MDKKYDSESLHRKIRGYIGADSVIPVRIWQGRIRSGTHRQEMYTNFDKNGIASEARSKQPSQLPKGNSEKN